MGLTLKEVAELVRGTLVGDPTLVIDGVGPIESAGPTQIAALDADRFLAAAKSSRAAAVLAPKKLALQLERTHIVTPFPQIAQNLVIERLGLWPQPWNEMGRHPTALVDPSAQIGSDVAIGAYAVVGARATLGDGTRLAPHAVVEADAAIGQRCRIGSHAVIASPTTLGEDCVVGHGAVIGGEGFGFGFGPTGPVRLCHLGRVVVGNRVHVGNYSTIDRARFGETRVGDDVKLDSHVHLGHNVVVGARTICAAFVGVAGSTTIGEECLLGGQSGVGDHLTIASKVRIAAKSGISADIDEPGDYYGFWAKKRRQGLEEMVALSRLPDALKEIEQLKRTLAALENRLRNSSDSDPTPTGHDR